MVAVVPQAPAKAVNDNGTFVLVSPRSSTAYITSPGRFHNGCAAEDYYDSPDFDDGTCIKAASVDGDFSLDVAGADGNAAWVDIDPEAIDGQGSGGNWRLVAGAIGTWDANCDNGAYQTFYLQTKNALNQWENNAKITIGHADTWQYDEDEVVIGESSGQENAIVGYVANWESGCWDEHLHVQVWNYEAYARIFDLDGKVLDDPDTDIDGPCNRAGSSTPDDCNVQLLSSDGFGYAGGSNALQTEFNNPYFREF